MNWRKTTATAFLALVVLFGMTGCPKKPPAVPVAPTGPDSTWTGVSAVFHVTTTAKSNIRYVMNWSDKTDTTADSYASAETAAMSHTWGTAGTYDIKVQAILDAEPAKASEFSPTKAVKVILNSEPVVDSVRTPTVAVKDAESFLTVFGSDADGDSMRILVNWGGGSPTDTGYFQNPFGVQVSHVFTKVETVQVIVTVQDWKGAQSAPDTVYVPVGTAGGVKWAWQSSTAESEGEPLTTSVVIALVGTEERLFSGCDGDCKFYSIRTSDKKGEKGVTTKELDAVFSGHPGLANGHIIVGSDEGELYALALDGLHKDWQWPDSASEHGTYVEWGAPAFNGDKIYIGHDDDSLFLFQDAFSQGNRIAAYGLDSATVNDAPIVDAAGNVIFSTNSGRLVKVDANLQPIWSAQLLANGDVDGPILGYDGTIYCATESSRLYAIVPDSGSVKSGWPLTLDGEVSRPALGRSALFVGSTYGKAYSINPATGSINWEKALSPTSGFSTTPIVAANGYVYFQDESDVLFCVNQADGTVIWSCDCPSFLPPPTRSGNSHRPRKLELTGYLPNPSICANGDIIVLGDDACYCVAGYPEGPLDAAAAWPKWQKNLFNASK